MHTLRWVISNGTNTVSTEVVRCAYWLKGGGGVGWRDYFFFSLVMTSYGKGIGQPGTGAGVGLDTRASRMEVSFGVKRELCFF